MMITPAGLMPWEAVMKSAYETAVRVREGKFDRMADAAPQSVPIDKATARVVNAIFKAIKGCRSAWRQSWPDDQAEDASKLEWTKALMAARIRMGQIRYGIQQLRQMPGDFAPSSGTFIELCMPAPEKIGLPSVNRAYREACANAHPAATVSWSHPAVEHAACETGLHELRTLAEDRSRRLFERNYAVAVRMVLADEPLRAIPLGLPDPYSVSSVRTEEVGRAALVVLRATVRGAAHD